MADAIGETLLVVVPIFVCVFGGVVFLFVIAQFISPKFRGKLMSRQVKSLKYMMDESKDDLEDISTNMADATKTGVGITTKAIRDGIVGDNVTYCKYCDSIIDSDSKYCKKCGKEQ